MKKELYEAPLLEVIEIEDSDIILWQSFGTNEDEYTIKFGELFK